MSGTPERDPKKQVTSEKWVVKSCYVKADRDLEPLQPLEVYGLALPGFPFPPESATPREEESTRRDPLVKYEPRLSSAAVIPASVAVEASSASEMQKHPQAILREMYADFKDKRQEELMLKNWKQRIPHVIVKQEYLDEPGPPGKRSGIDFVDDPHASDKDVRRASWPKKFSKDKVRLNGFDTFLEREARGPSHAKDLVRGAERALGCLEITNATADSTVHDIDDVKVLIGLYLNKAHKQLLQMPLIHPRLGWAKSFIEGLVDYAIFWLRTLKQDAIESSAEPFEKYKDCLDALIHDLKSGHLKRCQAWREIGFAEQAKEDLYVLQNFPSIDDMVQPAVRRGYCMLVRIGEKYSGRGDVPGKVLGLLNCILVGSWHYDTYLGRKWEIENCLRTTITEALDELLEYILCRKHKTYKTYGDLIKLLTPGLIQALIIYRKCLKQRQGRKYFFVPVHGSAKTISIPYYFSSYNKMFLSGAKVKPKTNQVRKLFHNTLMKLTKDENKLKDLMTVLDAHGRPTQDKHYLIKTPEDDLKLAKALVKNVIGNTVSWPSREEAEAVTEESAMVAALEGMSEEFDGQKDSEDCDPDDQPDEHWDFGSLFGIYPPGHLDTVPLMDGPASSSSQAIVSAEASPIPLRASCGVACLLRSPSEPPPRPRKDKKGSPIDPAKLQLYEEFAPSSAPGQLRTRIPVSDEAHAWMDQQLEDWQRAEGKATLIINGWMNNETNAEVKRTSKNGLIALLIPISINNTISIIINAIIIIIIKCE
jgi:hypothetical protein